MNKITKTLFKSFLKWNRQREVQHAVFAIKYADTLLSDVVFRSKNVQVQRFLQTFFHTIDSPEQLQYLIYFCFYNAENNSHNIDLSFTVLKQLNELFRVEIKPNYVIHSRNKAVFHDVPQTHNYFKIGEVVQHKKLHYRGIVIGYNFKEVNTIDINARAATGLTTPTNTTTNTNTSQPKEFIQSVNILVDAFDSNEFVRDKNNNPNYLYTLENTNSHSLMPVKQANLSRIFNTTTDRYFAYYDVEKNRYIANKELMYFYPYDYMELVSNNESAASNSDSNTGTSINGSSTDDRGTTNINTQEQLQIHSKVVSTMQTLMHRFDTILSANGAAMVDLQRQYYDPVFSAVLDDILSTLAKNKELLKSFETTTAAATDTYHSTNSDSSGGANAYSIPDLKIHNNNGELTTPNTTRKLAVGPRMKCLHDSELLNGGLSYFGRELLGAPTAGAGAVVRDNVTTSITATTANTSTSASSRAATTHLLVNSANKCCDLISHTVLLFNAIDQLLQLRFQAHGLAYHDKLSVLSKSVDTTDATATDSTNKSINTSRLHYEPSSNPIIQRLEKDSHKVKPRFNVGTVVRHKKFGYRGVVYGYDVFPLTDVSSWEGVVGLANGTEQPFYRVIPDDNDVKRIFGADVYRSYYYAAQDNLELLSSPTTTSSSTIINSRSNSDDRNLYIAGQSNLFQGFDQEHGVFRVPHKLHYCFPSLPHVAPVSVAGKPVLSLPPRGATTNKTSTNSTDAPAMEKINNGSSTTNAVVQAQHEQAVYDAIDVTLVQMHTLLKQFFIDIRDSASSDSAVHATDPFKLNDVLMLLKHAANRENALSIESLLWQIWLAHPNSDVNTLVRYGLSNTKRGRIHEALENYKLAVQLDPMFAEPRNKIAILHHVLNRHDKCITTALEVVKLLPSHYGALAGLAISYEKIGRKEAALEMIQQALDMHPWVANLPTLHISLSQELAAESERRMQGSEPSSGSSSSTSSSNSDQEDAADKK